MNMSLFVHKKSLLKKFVKKIKEDGVFYHVMMFIHSVLKQPMQIDHVKHKILKTLIQKHNYKVAHGPFKGMKLNENPIWSKYDLITQTYGYTFQKNFFYDFTDIVLLIKSNYKLFLTQKKLSDVSELQKCFVKNGKQDLFFLEKKTKKHVAENELFLETITNNDYDYYAVEKKCLIANLKKSK